MHDIEALYLEVFRKKAAIMGRILGDWAGGQDVAQEAFCRAWKFYPSFNPERGTIHKWFNGILFNALRSYQREIRGGPLGNAREVFPEDLISSLRADPTVLREAIEAVSNEKHRRVLELFYLLGYTSMEIDQIEEKMTQTNVTTIIHRFNERMMK